MGIPPNGWFAKEIPTKMNNFWGTPILENLHMGLWRIRSPTTQCASLPLGLTQPKGELLWGCSSLSNALLKRCSQVT